MFDCSIDFLILVLKEMHSCETVFHSLINIQEKTPTMSASFLHILSSAVGRINK